MSFDLNSFPVQKGKIAIVTGANSGVGFETVIGLAKKEMKVVMACRDLKKGEEAKKAILSTYPQADLDVMALDLGSLESVRSFSAMYLQKYKALDILVNNAGVMVPPFSKTKDGFESQFGVNFLAHFLLTNLLFPLLKSTPDSRVVSLSSIAHKNGKIDFNNLNSEKSYSKWVAYSQSKLACLMFAYELQKRIHSAGLKITSVAAHPGVSITNLWQHMPPGLFNFIRPIFSLFTHTPDKAAQPVLYAALAKNLKGGDYVGPTGFREMKGNPGKAFSSRQSLDTTVTLNLWAAAEKMTGQKFLL